MIPIQLDFFKSEEECRIDALTEMLDLVKKSSDKVRRGMYARLGDLTKECNDLRGRLEIMERHICKGESHGTSI